MDECRHGPVWVGPQGFVGDHASQRVGHNDARIRSHFGDDSRIGRAAKAVVREVTSHLLQIEDQRPLRHPCKKVDWLKAFSALCTI